MTGMSLTDWSVEVTFLMRDCWNCSIRVLPFAARFVVLRDPED